MLKNIIILGGGVTTQPPIFAYYVEQKTDHLRCKGLRVGARRVSVTAATA